MKSLRKYGPFVALLLALVFLVIILFNISPTEIVERVGVNNSYFVLFLLALFGGASIFTSSSFYASLVVFAVGGLNPVLIALAAAPGLVLSDVIYYFIGYEVRVTFLSRYEKQVEKVANWLEAHPKSVPFAIYVYSGFTPLPGDLLMLILAMAQYPLRKAIIPVVCGALTLIFLIAFLAQQGITLVT